MTKYSCHMFLLDITKCHSIKHSLHISFGEFHDRFQCMFNNVTICDLTPFQIPNKMEILLLDYNFIFRIETKTSVVIKIYFYSFLRKYFISYTKYFNYVVILRNDIRNYKGEF